MYVSISVFHERPHLCRKQACCVRFFETLLCSSISQGPHRNDLLTDAENGSCVRYELEPFAKYNSQSAQVAKKMVSLSHNKSHLYPILRTIFTFEQCKGTLDAQKRPERNVF